MRPLSLHFLTLLNSRRSMKPKSKFHPAPELSGHILGPHNIDLFLDQMVGRREIAPEFIIVDLFCGAGGTSTGFEMASDKALVIACVNHDFKAILSHWRNYPHVAHFNEDIRTLNLNPLVQLVRYYRKLYPKAKL